MPISNLLVMYYVLQCTRQTKALIPIEFTVKLDHEDTKEEKSVGSVGSAVEKNEARSGQWGTGKEWSGWASLRRRCGDV